MPEETEFTFAHFVDPEALAARVGELDGKYGDEEVAATAFYLGILSITGMARAFHIVGDSHYLMHLMANVYAGEWMTELIKAGCLNPEAIHDLVLREHGDLLRPTPHEATDDGMEDIKSEVEQHEPMDRDTFNRLWGPNA